jgi:hypothetical protein
MPPKQTRRARESGEEEAKPTTAAAKPPNNAAAAAATSKAVATNEAAKLKGGVQIVRPEFGGTQGVNYSKNIEIVNPHRIRFIKGFRGIAVAHEQPLSTGIVAFGFRLSEGCAKEFNSVYIGLTTNATPGNKDDVPGQHRKTPGLCLNLYGANVSQTDLDQGIDNVIDEKIAQAPNTVVVTRVDFNTRIVTFFVNGVETKIEPPLTLPKLDGPFYAVVNMHEKKDEVEAIAEDDPAFVVLA